MVDISFENEEALSGNLCTIRVDSYAGLAIPVPAALIKDTFTGSTATATSTHVQGTPSQTRQGERPEITRKARRPLRCQRASNMTATGMSVRCRLSWQGST